MLKDVNYRSDRTFALDMDQNDHLKSFRDLFFIPKNNNGSDSIYFCGNSLGLQPKNCKTEIDQVLNAWSKRGVESWFESDASWINSHSTLKESMKKLVGCMNSEIAIANSLSVNLHLLLLSFYRPNQTRYKIVIEANAFPSDQYIVKSQAHFHQYDVNDTIITISPKKGKINIEYDDIATCLQNHGHQTSIILLGGVNYVNGQVLNLKKITQLGHQYGCMVGFDLAHAVGNIPLNLHDDEVDFAAWCNYKYLNAGPGSVGAFYIHHKHHSSNLPRLEGWWGNSLDSRFLMKDKFDPSYGAEAWVMSTPSQLNYAALRASLEIFDMTTIEDLRQKSILLTGYLEYLIENLSNTDIELITPKDRNQRGCQLSLKIKNGKEVFEGLINSGVICDWREPDIIRISPAPLYNTFEEVYNLVLILSDLVSK